MAFRSAAAYVAPFALFIGFLAVNSFWPVPQWTRFVLELALIAAVSRQVLRSQAVSRLSMSVLIGIGVFLIWIAPDALIPGYRSLPPFHNALVGSAAATTTGAQQRDLLFLVFRVLNSVAAIPILEELFWRGFLMRWLIRQDFEAVPLGAWSRASFWLVALLFASEHGPYWDVGLAAGIAYNWWMLRTGNLWDCIVAHAVTNGCLAVYVIGAGQWRYWM